ncbi:MAG TPA: nitroreductase family deazaflavin-dependent oxidoreductase [Candidatus Limnocylindrales bacterium]|nr:nitroreductase family deazaflavin-dependent oxidoreductase [Candidatus Limnocylindrales bacterium]
MNNAQKFWKTLGESSFYKNMGKVHTWLYRRSGGRFGHKTGPFSNLLLTTKGRKSGQPRTCPLTYFEDDGRYVLIASNGGNDRHPAWYLNLQADPTATVDIGSERRTVTASTAAGAERERLWKAAVDMNPQYGVYESITARSIPVVILSPK